MKLTKYHYHVLMIKDDDGVHTLAYFHKDKVISSKKDCVN